MSTQSYYQVLQVDVQASSEVIEAAYRRLARLYHPDLSKKVDAIAKMQELNEAYSILRDPAQRRRYDEKLRSSTSQQARSYTNTQTTTNTDEAILNYPAFCQKCGQSDPGLRIVFFPYVVSIVLLTFRRAWGGLYCIRCRRQEMFKAKIISFFLGWWGIPFGLFYTLGVLFKSSQGEVPPDANATYLQGLGAYFLSRRKIIDAEQALAASLAYQYNEKVDALYQHVFERKPQLPTYTSSGQSEGFLFGIGAIGLIVLILALIPTPPSTVIQEAKPNYYLVASPTSAWTITFPTAKPSPTVEQTPTIATSPTPVLAKAKPPKGWQQFVNKQARFLAYIPEEFIPEEHPPTEDNPLRAVSFAADSQNMGPDATVISVLYLPFVDVAGSEISESELKGLIGKWLAQRKVKLINPPMKINVGKYSGFKVVHQASLTDKRYTVRAHAAFILADKGLYYVEVAGMSQYDDILRQYYNTFMDWFQPDID